MVRNNMLDWMRFMAAAIACCYLSFTFLPWENRSDEQSSFRPEPVPACSVRAARQHASLIAVRESCRKPLNKPQDGQVLLVSQDAIGLECPVLAALFEEQGNLRPSVHTSQLWDRGPPRPALG